MAESKLGDVEVLTYQHGTGSAWAIQCKRTHQDKTSVVIKIEYDNYFGRLAKDGMIKSMLTDIIG